ncbi:MAG: DNA adenine methylase [Bacteroides sp.]|nr:DNA adenine methylase [Bacteroides sp.]
MQYSLFTEVDEKNLFPTTRYQGSKAKFVDWIGSVLSDVKFDTALDAFGGTGSVAYLFKDRGKKVTYNDILPFNAMIGKAIIENSCEKLDECDLKYILTEHQGIVYPNFISETFHDIYYTDEENHWLDVVCYNIRHIENEYEKALAWFALFQACIIKRPYNLFHRKNLYVRLSDVQRSFGNKKTWDTPFETHFRNFVTEANRAVFDNGRICTSINQDALSISRNLYDLVYIDTPYLNEKGIGVDYADFYHFLNGMLEYESWGKMIDYDSKHRRLKRVYSLWNDKEHIMDGFRRLIEIYRNSILVFSYRSNGIPAINSIVSLLDGCKRRNEIHYSWNMKYALSDIKSREVLIISYPS